MAYNSSIEMSGYWWCNDCDAEIDARNVTHEELHELCGSPAEWIKDPDGLTMEDLGEEEDERLFRECGYY